MIKTTVSRILRRFNYQISRVSTIPHSQSSVLVPTESWLSAADDRLIDLSLKAIAEARLVDHSDIASKMKEYPHWPVIWPGEHYKLLSGLVKALAPQLIVEIGTATGYSALAMKKFLPASGKIISYDVFNWRDIPNCILTDDDFKEKKLEQRVADLTDPAVFEKHIPDLKLADFVFIDAAKDGIQERRFIQNFERVPFVNPPIFMFDDTRVVNMIEIWNSIQRPKLDLTSFGHWSGTGLVNWLP